MLVRSFPAIGLIPGRRSGITSNALAHTCELQFYEIQASSALLRLAGVDEIHRRKDAEPACLSHGIRAQVQCIRYTDRALRRNVERLHRL